MKATLFINGHKVGSLEYDLPKDDAGRSIPLPSPGDRPGDASVQIDGPDGAQWFGMADLLRLD